MRKNLILPIFILLIVICAPLMADKKTSILTAFKENVTTGTNADLFVDFNLLDSSDVIISEGREVNIPQEFRQTAYNTFSWVLHGNAYRIISLEFQFSPMQNNNVKESESQKKDTIKYKVELTHQSTRIGNDAISSYSRTLSANERTAMQQGSSIPFTYYTNNIPATYDMYYADYYQFSNSSITVNNSATTISLTYNFSTNTVASGFPAGANVCNSWNRYGTAVVTLLEIDQGASNYATGNYEAPVRLTITPGN